MNLSARQLKAFLALAEECHFTRAAKRCHLTQPAFSALIQSLEDALGVRLFDRSTRRVTLTAEGRHFYRSAPRLLNDIDALVSEMRDLASKRRGRVSVAALPSLAAGWLPSVCVAFSNTYPGVEISVHDALLEPCIQRVREGAADLALAACGRDMAGLLAEPLCEDQFYMVCRQDHPLALSKEVEIEALKGEPMIHLGKGSSIRQSLAAHPAIGDMTSALEVDHLATVRGFVLAGMGVSLIPGMALFHFRHAELRIVPLAPECLIRRQLFLLRRDDRSLSKAAEAFYDMVMQQRHTLTM